MTAWTHEELDKISKADELEIASLQQDGKPGKFVTIWVVRAGSELYVRSYKGRGSGWFKGVLVNHAGRIRAGGVEKNVTFVEETSPVIQEQIDAAYRAKYRGYGASIVGSVVTETARGATLKLEKRGPD
jgi:hypothetical protein